MLKRGGNAVDAAIAANATLGLMEPISNGVGGDLFAIVYIARENKLYGLNGSGRSPMGLSYEQAREEVAKLHRNFLPPIGMLPINVPGAVDAWATLHDRFGKLTLADDLSRRRPLRRGGLPRHGNHRLLLGPQPERLQGPARRVEGNLHPARHRPAPRPRATCSRTRRSPTPCA